MNNVFPQIFSNSTAKNVQKNNKSESSTEEEKKLENARYGNMLWKELHNRALTFRGHNDSSFIVDFSEKIPQFLSGCKCNEFFNKYVLENPPNYSPNRYFEWTVRCHNAVNHKLGKKLISVEEARRIHSS